MTSRGAKGATGKPSKKGGDVDAPAKPHRANGRTAEKAGGAERTDGGGNRAADRGRADTRPKGRTADAPVDPPEGVGTPEADPPEISEEEAKKILYRDYFSDEKAAKALEIYLKAVVANRAVSRNDLERLYSRHVLDCCRLIDLMPKNRRSRGEEADYRAEARLNYLDLGSGNGFPGVLVAMLRNYRCFLLEERASRAAFLKNVSRETSRPFTVVHGRWDADRRPEGLPRFDIITARAVAPPATVVGWLAPWLPKNATTNRVSGSTTPQNGLRRGCRVIIPCGKSWRRQLEDLTAAPESWDHVPKPTLHPNVGSPTSMIIRLDFD